LFFSFPEEGYQFLLQNLGSPRRVRRVFGGDIHSTYLWEGKERYFVKFALKPPHRIFYSEAEGLEALSGGKSFRVPEVVIVEENRDWGVLVLSWMELRKEGDSSLLASGLWEVHQRKRDRFGWNGKTYLGILPQENGFTEKLSTFLWEKRIQPHFSHFQKRRGSFLLPWEERLRSFWEKNGSLLEEGSEPTLTHGDFWGGNHAFDEKGLPVFFDPSPAYLFPEWDIGFFLVFHSFSNHFVQKYLSFFPEKKKDDSFWFRVLTGKLILLLAHATLFGGGYIEEVCRVSEEIVEKFS